MKKILVCVLAIMPLFFLSCESKNGADDTTVENPKEDVGLEYIVHVGDLIGSFWLAYKISNCVEIQDGSMCCRTSGVYVASVGSVNSLKDVDYVPTSGWATDMAITLGHGYVFKLEGCNTYNRVRFLEYIDKGSAKGYRVRCQEGWDPLLD